jgi:hypothetical protein
VRRGHQRDLLALRVAALDPLEERADPATDLSHDALNRRAHRPRLESPAMATTFKAAVDSRQPSQ